jgi:hypothetical protein
MKKEYQLRRIIGRFKKRANSRYTDTEAAKRTANRIINAYKAVTDCDPKPFELYKLASILDYVYENSQRVNAESAKIERTRGEWEALEARYVGSPPPIDDDSKFCAAWDCWNTLPKKSRKKYCPGGRCANEQKMAKDRLKKHGTMLPVEAYKPKRAETVDKVVKGSESAKAPDKLDYVNSVRTKKRASQDSRPAQHRIRNVRFHGDTGGDSIFRVNIANGNKTIEDRVKYRSYFNAS